MTPFEIYKQGKTAKLAGEPESANPYKYGTREYTYWWDGWIDN